MTEPPRHVLRRWAYRAPRPTPKRIHTRTHGERINPAAPYSPECRNIPCREHRVRPGCLTLRGCNMRRSSCQAKYNRLCNSKCSSLQVVFFCAVSGPVVVGDSKDWGKSGGKPSHSLMWFYTSWLLLSTFFLMFIEKLSSTTMVYTI